MTAPGDLFLSESKKDAGRPIVCPVIKLGQVAPLRFGGERKVGGVKTVKQRSHPGLNQKYQAAMLVELSILNHVPGQHGIHIRSGRP